MGSRFFQDYVANINRVHLIEMIEAFNHQRSPRRFKASLVVNPVTGRPYGSGEVAKAPVN